MSTPRLVFNSPRIKSSSNNSLHDIKNEVIFGKKVRFSSSHVFSPNNRSRESLNRFIF